MIQTRRDVADSDGDARSPSHALNRFAQTCNRDDQYPKRKRRIDVAHRSRFLLAALCVILHAGCAGHATIHMLPMGPKPIKTTGPLVIEVAPDECYYWVNDDRDLCVAMRAHRESLFGERVSSEFVLSLVLDGVPAGSGRYYRLGRRAVRAKRSAGYTHTRSASLSGIAVVWDYGRRNLRGRFRLTAKQQSYSVLTGWRGNRRVLFIGEFAAVANQATGEWILARTEENGMARPPSRQKLTPVQRPPPAPTDKDGL